MKVVRVNLSLGQGDYELLRRVAGFHRVPVGTYARTCLVSAILKEFRQLTASGELSEFEQLSLFEKERRKR